MICGQELESLSAAAAAAAHQQAQPFRAEVPNLNERTQPPWCAHDDLAAAQQPHTIGFNGKAAHKGLAKKLRRAASAQEAEQLDRTQLSFVGSSAQRLSTIRFVCSASSRVGSMTSTWGAVPLPGLTQSAINTPNVSVLPVPDFACAWA
jgi:hypothetical protein